MPGRDCCREKQLVPVSHATSPGVTGVDPVLARRRFRAKVSGLRRVLLCSSGHTPLATARPVHSARLPRSAVARRKPFVALYVGGNPLPPVVYSTVRLLHELSSALPGLHLYSAHQSDRGRSWPQSRVTGIVRPPSLAAGAVPAGHSA